MKRNRETPAEITSKFRRVVPKQEQSEGNLNNSSIDHTRSPHGGNQFNTHQMNW